MKKDKIKRFIDCYVPILTCNLRCHYCYITQQRKFDSSLPEFKYSAEYIAKALSKERLGGACCLNFCGGGETLLPVEMIDIVRCLLEEGHYVMIVTNGTLSKRFDEIVKMPKELLERLFFKFSFHYLELKRLNIMDSFFDNIRKIREAGCSFTLEITPSDELIPHIEDVKKTALENVQALPHITVARDNTKYKLPILTSHKKSDYKKIWGQFKSGLFDYKISVFNKKRREFCHAGDWTLYLNIGTGELKQCYMGDVLQNIYENVDEPLHCRPIGKKCRESHCYNAHAFLTFGAIPEHKSPTYNEMRDRVCTDGSHWCSQTVRDFFSQKLKDNNTPTDSRILNHGQSIFKKIFSMKNEFAEDKKKYKIITFFGIKHKFRTKNKKHKLNPVSSLINDIKDIKENQKNIRLYLEFERFDRHLREIAPKDRMTFVCINGFGDTMLYASYWKELEAKYQTKIFWVVQKDHEVILKMYGITNYTTFDYISFKKQGHFSDFINVTPYPVKGVPFYAHWTYNSATSNEEKYFADFVKKSMDLGNIPFNNPVWYPEISDRLKEKIKGIKDLKKTILISPNARYLPIDNEKFWNTISSSLLKKGFEVIINNNEQNMVISSTVDCIDLTSEELVALAMNTYAVISPRSGFTDIVHQLGKKLFVIYPSKFYYDMYTLNKICSTKDVHEYIYSSDLPVKKLICDIEKLSYDEAVCV